MSFIFILWNVIGKNVLKYRNIKCVISFVVTNISFIFTIILNYVLIFIILVTITKYINFECIILTPKIIGQDLPLMTIPYKLLVSYLYLILNQSVHLWNLSPYSYHRVASPNVCKLICSSILQIRIVNQRFIKLGGIFFSFIIA